MSAVDKRAAILQHAEFLVRTRGYSDFSFADLAEGAQIRKASVHHYFPTKADLGVALINDYLDRFRGDLERIDAEQSTVKDKLVAYANLFAGALNDSMLPLCGALSAGSSALPDRMRPLVAAFFELHLEWLQRVIRNGISAGEVRAGKSPDKSALLLLSSLEGGSLIAWALGNNTSLLHGFEEALEGLLV